MFSIHVIFFFFLNFVKCRQLNNSCEMSIASKFEPKIVGGQAVDIERYAFAVQFINMGRLCGGVIINSWSIVTAGHCLAFSTDTKQMVIQAGKYFYCITIYVYIKAPLKQSHINPKEWN